MTARSSKYWSAIPNGLHISPTNKEMECQRVKAWGERDLSFSTNRHPCTVRLLWWYISFRAYKGHSGVSKLTCFACHQGNPREFPWQRTKQSAFGLRMAYIGAEPSHNCITNRYEVQHTRQNYNGKQRLNATKRSRRRGVWFFLVFRIQSRTYAVVRNAATIFRDGMFRTV